MPPEPAPAGSPAFGAGLLVGLSPEQVRAVQAPPGPLLLVAGPGSGKTLVLTRRLAHLLAHTGLGPERVLAICFANRAARELGERLKELIGPAAAGRVTVATFHAAALRLVVRPHAARLGRSGAFSIYDGPAARRTVALALRREPLDLPASEAQARIARHKAALRAPGDLAYRGEGTLGRVWARYELELARADALDFEDLVAGAVRLLGEHPDLRTALRRRFGLVLVDELQDTSRAQVRLLQLLVGAEPNLTAAADEDQAIFGFRGADVAHVVGFEELFPGARALALGRNFRSSRPIVEAAGRLIAHNAQRRSKHLYSLEPGGPAVRVERHPDARAEAVAAADWCRRRLAERVAPGELAVLFRAREQAGPLEQALLVAQVPYRLLGGPGLFAHSEVRDALAYLALIANPRDRVAFERALGSPRRGLGPVAVGRLVAHAERHGLHLLHALLRAGDVPGLRAGQVAVARQLGVALGTLSAGHPGRRVGALVAETVVASGLPRALAASPEPGAPARVERLRDLVRAARAYENSAGPPGLVAFLARAALAAGEPEGEPPRVSLATAHAAKGLEWRCVRIVGVEEGRLPHLRAVGEGALEEERRLAYVALTRARHELVLSWAASRYGRPTRPSRFLTEAGLGPGLRRAA